MADSQNPVDDLRHLKTIAEELALTIVFNGFDSTYDLRDLGQNEYGKAEHNGRGTGKTWVRISLKSWIRLCTDESPYPELIGRPFIRTLRTFLVSQIEKVPKELRIPPAQRRTAHLMAIGFERGHMISGKPVFIEIESEASHNTAPTPAAEEKTETPPPPKKSNKAVASEATASSWGLGAGAEANK